MSNRDTRTAGFLDALGHELGQVLGSLWKVRDLQPGDVLIQEGDAGRSLYIILSGRFEIVKDTMADGQYTVIGILSDNACCGELTFLLGGRYTATVRAAMPREETEESTHVVAEITHTDLLALTAQNPAFAAAFNWVLAQMLGDRLVHTTNQYTDAQIKLRFLNRLIAGARQVGFMPNASSAPDEDATAFLGRLIKLAQDTGLVPPAPSSLG